MHRHTPLVKTLPPTFPIGGTKTGLADVLPAQRRCKPHGTNQKASSPARCKNGFSTVAEAKKTPQSSFSPTYGCYVKTYDSDWGCKNGFSTPYQSSRRASGCKNGFRQTPSAAERGSREAIDYLLKHQKTAFAGWPAVRSGKPRPPHAPKGRTNRQTRCKNGFRLPGCKSWFSYVRTRCRRRFRRGQNPGKHRADRG